MNEIDPYQELENLAAFGKAIKDKESQARRDFLAKLDPENKFTEREREILIAATLVKAKETSAERIWAKKIKLSSDSSMAHKDPLDLMAESLSKWAAVCEVLFAGFGKEPLKIITEYVEEVGRSGLPAPQTEGQSLPPHSAKERFF